MELHENMNTYKINRKRKTVSNKRYDDKNPSKWTEFIEKQLKPLTSRTLSCENVGIYFETDTNVYSQFLTLISRLKPKTLKKYNAFMQNICSYLNEHENKAG